MEGGHPQGFFSLENASGRARHPQGIFPRKMEGAGKALVARLEERG